MKKCPQCREARECVRLPAWTAPASMVWTVTLGPMACAVFAALPAKFRCRTCGREFRRYTGWGLAVLALLIFLLFSPTLFWLFMGRGG